jgi:hypothetical protein
MKKSRLTEKQILVIPKESDAGASNMMPQALAA